MDRSGLRGKHDRTGADLWTGYSGRLKKNDQTEEQTRALYRQGAATAEPDSTPNGASLLAKLLADTDKPSPQPTETAGSTTPLPTLEVAFAPDLPPVETPPPVQEAFQELYNQNKHIIGWLTAGERIDYPVVWYEGNNDYYLHHDFFGKNDNNGTLFLNGNNRFFPANDVWLIHGHNMASGAMFATLGKYRDYRYLCEHPLVEFRTIYDAEMVYYVPIAAFDASMIRGNRGYFNVTQIAFPDDQEATASPLPGEPVSADAVLAMEAPAATTAPAKALATATASTQRQSAAFQAYLNSLQRRSLWDSPAGVNVDDSLLLLITCSYTQEDGRFILACRKLREGETAEDVTALFE